MQNLEASSSTKHICIWKLQGPILNWYQGYTPTKIFGIQGNKKQAIIGVVFNKNLKASIILIKRVFNNNSSPTIYVVAV